MFIPRGFLTTTVTIKRNNATLLTGVPARIYISSPGDEAFAAGISDMASSKALIRKSDLGATVLQTGDELHASDFFYSVEGIRAFPSSDSRLTSTTRGHVELYLRRNAY